MQAGELRHQIFVAERATTRNGLGEDVPYGRPPQPFEGRMHYAAIRPTSAREVMQGKTLAHEVTHIITLRYTPDVTPTSIIGFKDRFFEVAGIINVDERDVELQVLAKEST